MKKRLFEYTTATGEDRKHESTETGLELENEEVNNFMIKPDYGKNSGYAITKYEKCTPILII